MFLLYWHVSCVTNETYSKLVYWVCSIVPKILTMFNKFKNFFKWDRIIIHSVTWASEAVISKLILWTLWWRRVFSAPSPLHHLASCLGARQTPLPFLRLGTHLPQRHFFKGLMWAGRGGTGGGAFAIKVKAGEEKEILLAKANFPGIW